MGIYEEVIGAGSLQQKILTWFTHASANAFTIVVIVTVLADTTGTAITYRISREAVIHRVTTLRS